MDDGIREELGVIKTDIKHHNKVLDEVKTDVKELREEVTEIRLSLTFWKGKMAGAWVFLTAAVGAAVATAINLLFKQASE